jgi:hypothetical protein
MRGTLPPERRAIWSRLVARASLYLDTVRNMRPGQLVARGGRAVPARVLAAGTTPRSSPRWLPRAAGLGVDPAPQPGVGAAPERTGTFVAYGASRRFGGPDFWRDRSDGLLFLFHIHGFSGLASYAHGPRTPAGDHFWGRVVDSWMTSERRPRRPAWHPHPTSLRIIALAAAISAIESWSSSFKDRVASELLRQGRYLRRGLERDVGGNHVLKNATALAFAGAVLPNSRLLDAGLRVLERELARQVLSDGGHEERSTSYHRNVAHDLDDVAELVRRCGRSVPRWLAAAIERTRAWQAAMRGPDGCLPLLNDAWEGPPDEAAAGHGVVHLAESGYVVLRNGRDQAIFDAGPICPPHLPAHAHADVLSFVLWGDGEPVMVDPGSYTYTGPWRDHFRGTAAHNTVEVDGRDQCVFWGDFRAARLPTIGDVSIRYVDDAAVVSAWHDGYRRLDDPVRHHRTLVWLPGAGLVVVDRLGAESEHRIRSSLHLSPRVASRDPDRAGPFTVAALGRDPDVRRREDWYAPALGTKTRATVIEDLRQVAPRAPFGWSLLRPGSEIELAGDRLTVSRGASQLVVTLPEADR